MDECICAEWDGKGVSTCGVECSEHPPEGNCPKCKTKTHKDQLCFICENVLNNQQQPKGGK